VVKTREGVVSSLKGKLLETISKDGHTTQRKIEAVKGGKGKRRKKGGFRDGWKSCKNSLRATGKAKVPPRRKLRQGKRDKERNRAREGGKDW